VLPGELAVRPAILWEGILLWGGEEKKLRITKKEKTHAGKRIANRASIQYLIIRTGEKLKRRSPKPYKRTFKFDSPWLAGTKNYEEFREFSKIAHEKIRRSKNAREMVLETWFLLDYVVREIILFAFDLKDYSTEDFDLRFEFLPKSFEECLSALEKMTRHLPSVLDIPANYMMQAPRSFWDHLRFNKKNLHKKLLKEQEVYLKKDFGHLEENEKKILAMKSSYVPKRVKNSWFEDVKHINEDWFKTARRFNKARNYAAHSVREESVLKQFGLSGPNGKRLLKRECYLLINNVVGVDIKKWLRPVKPI